MFITLILCHLEEKSDNFAFPFLVSLFSRQRTFPSSTPNVKIENITIMGDFFSLF